MPLVLVASVPTPNPIRNSDTPTSCVVPPPAQAREVARPNEALYNDRILIDLTRLGACWNLAAQPVAITVIPVYRNPGCRIE
jgi:hypothetical protein